MGMRKWEIEAKRMHPLCQSIHKAIIEIEKSEAYEGETDEHVLRAHWILLAVYEECRRALRAGLESRERVGGDGGAGV